MFWYVVFALPMLAIAASTKPNFVVILTDDQDLLLNSLIPMKKTIKLIANQGKTFTNAFVNSPICCPSRSTILTGKFPHNHGVQNNSLAGNCSSRNWQKNHEPFSISALLKQHANYTTFYAGKYLNQYGSKKSGGTEHVPLGYDWWIGLKGNSKYYNYSLSINGTEKFFQDEYLTDVLADYGLEFLEQSYVKNNGFFMMVAPPAPHAPFTPAARHAKEFPTAKAERTPSFNFTPYQKHWLLQLPSTHLPTNVTILDQIQRHRLQTLLAVDELVATLVNKLHDLKILNNTYIIFTSDNGYHIGQFAQPWDKRQPYETDIRVPLLIRGPNVPKKSCEHFPVSAVDLAPTILDLAGVRVDTTKNSMDGWSFKSKLFSKHPTKFKKNILIEYWGEGRKDDVDESCPWKYDADNLSGCIKDNWCKCQDSRNNSYSCLVEISEEVRRKFCKFRDNENFIEVYDLVNDPHELRNIFWNIGEITIRRYKRTLEKLRRCFGSTCSSIN